MRLTRRITVLLVALAAAAPTVHAQEAADPVMPRAGSWGAEAILGGGFGANLLHFSSPTAAWLAGLSFNLVHESQDVSGIAATPDQSGWLGSADARLGRRWWRGERGERIRPLTGLGVLGGISRNPGVHSWNAGVYGELGASWFITPHASLGAAGELGATYARDRFLDGTTELTNTRWILRGTLVHVTASVYF